MEKHLVNLFFYICLQIFMFWYNKKSNIWAFFKGLIMQPNEFNTIIESINKLHQRFDDYKTQEPYHSTQTKELFIALAKAQGEFPVSIEFSSVNPHFKSKYADLDSIVRKIRPVLSRNGLAITQEERIMPNGSTVLHTRLHFEDQWTEVRVTVRPEKDNIQGYGSALSYHKRYSLMSLLFITTSSDPDDDDGESNMKYARLKEDVETNRKISADQTIYSSSKVTASQIQIIDEKLSGRKDVARELLRAYKVDSIEQLPQSEFFSICRNIEKNIQNNPKP